MGIPCIPVECVELTIPTMSSMFSECLDTLSLRKTIHYLLQQSEQLIKVFSDEKLCSKRWREKSLLLMR